MRPCILVVRASWNPGPGRPAKQNWFESPKGGRPISARRHLATLLEREYMSPSCATPELLVKLMQRVQCLSSVLELPVDCAGMSTEKMAKTVRQAAKHFLSSSDRSGRWPQGAMPVSGMPWGAPGDIPV
jgi:hypothetical protein